MSSASSMNQAIRQNRALQLKKNKAYFSNDIFQAQKRSSKPFRFKKPQGFEVRRLQQKFRRERRKERLIAFVSLLSGLLVCAWILDQLGVFSL